jgi:hypothetical protein
MLYNPREQVVRERKGTNSNICSSLLALWNSLKELPKILQSGSLHNLIKWADKNMKYRYTNNPAESHAPLQ